MAKKLNGAQKEAIIAAAKAMGIELSDADFEQTNELSDDELDTVAGGGICACVLGGGSADESSTYRASDAVCACVFGGSGTNKGGYSRCVCVMGGGGDSVICPCIGGGIG